MTIKLLFALFFICAALLGASAQERFLKPVDEGPKDASFVAFRKLATGAVARKDAKFIRSILAKDVIVNFGGTNGVRGFMGEWKDLSPASGFWKEFGWVISHGGKFETEKGSPKQFWAPYTYAFFPDDLDSGDYGTIAGERVRLRKAPSLTAEVIDFLDYNLAKPYFDGNETEGWMQIVTLGGKRGFIAADFFHSPLDYRAGFSKVNGKWLMTAFVSGD